MTKTYFTLVMSEDTEFDKPFLNKERKVVLGSTKVGSPNFAIHATQEQWEKLSAYCLECAEVLKEYALNNDES